MEFQMACATWVEEADELVLNLLRESDRWLTLGEIAERTGLPVKRVERTLRMLVKQMKMSEARKRLADLWETDE